MSAGTPSSIPIGSIDKRPPASEFPDGQEWLLIRDDNTRVLTESRGDQWVSVDFETKSLQADVSHNATSTSHGRRRSKELASRKSNVDLEELFGTYTQVTSQPFDAGDKYASIVHAPSIFDSPIEEWYAYVTAYQDDGVYLWTSDSLGGSWTSQGSVVSPVVDSGTPQLDKPRVLYDPMAGEVRLYYTTTAGHVDMNVNTSNMDLVPLYATASTSSDGSSFTYQDVVFQNDFSRVQRFDDNAINGFCPVRRDNGYVATYYGTVGSQESHEGYGVAWSHDGINWRRIKHPFGWHGHFATDMRSRTSTVPALVTIGDTDWVVFATSGTDTDTWALPVDWYDRRLSPDDKVNLNGPHRFMDAMEVGEKTYLFSGQEIGYVDWTEVVA